MPATVKYLIPYPDGNSNFTPLQDWFAGIANGVENALITGLGGAPRIANSDADRTTIFPSPAQGNLVERPDKGWLEQYHATYNSGTNPGGAPTPGWYPVGGKVPRLVRDAGTNQNLVPNTWTKYINYPAVPTNIPDAGFSFASGTWTVLQPGRYLLSFNVQTGGIGSGTFQSVGAFWVNGVQDASASASGYGSTTQGANYGTAYSKWLAVGDTVEVRVLQNGGANVDHKVINVQAGYQGV